MTRKSTNFADSACEVLVIGDDISACKSHRLLGDLLGSSRVKPQICAIHEIDLKWLCSFYLNSLYNDVQILLGKEIVFVLFKNFLLMPSIFNLEY